MRWPPPARRPKPVAPAIPPTARAAFPVGNVPSPSRSVVFPVGNAALPSGNVALPSGNVAFRSRNVALPSGNGAFREGNAALKTAKMASALAKTSKNAVFAVLTRGDGQKTTDHGGLGLAIPCPARTGWECLPRPERGCPSRSGWTIRRVPGRFQGKRSGEVAAGEDTRAPKMTIRIYCLPTHFHRFRVEFMNIDRLFSPWPVLNQAALRFYEKTHPIYSRLLHCCDMHSNLSAHLPALCCSRTSCFAA